MRVTLVLITCVFVVACAATTVIEEQTTIEEPIRESVPDVTVVSAGQEGVITKLRGVAYMHDEENDEYIVLRQGDTIPIGKNFYLAPKTTMKIEQGEGEEIFIYSKEREAYYKLEINHP